MASCAYATCLHSVSQTDRPTDRSVCSSKTRTGATTRQTRRMPPTHPASRFNAVRGCVRYRTAVGKNQGHTRPRIRGSRNFAQRSLNSSRTGFRNTANLLLTPMNWAADACIAHAGRHCCFPPNSRSGAMPWTQNDASSRQQDVRGAVPFA